MFYIQENGFVFQAELEELFGLLDWKSGRCGERLVRAVLNASFRVVARNDKGELIGLITAIDDGGINAYLPYVLVRPQDQRRGVGAAMLRRVLEHYRDYPRISLVSYPESQGFYEKAGLSFCETMRPMELSFFD